MIMKHGYRIIIDDDRNPADALRDLAWMLDNPTRKMGDGTLDNALQDGIERVLECGAIGERASQVRIVRTRERVG
jgi:hypothetical protein